MALIEWWLLLDTYELHLYTLCACNKWGFFLVERYEESDFIEKPKSIYMAPPLGKWLYSKSERVAM